MSKKISQLTGATSVSGSDLSYIVQGGTSKSASVSQIHAAVPRRHQIVATRCNVHNSTWGNGAGGRSDTRVENRQKHYLGNQAVSQLQVAVGGYYLTNNGNGEALIGNDYSYEAAIELSSPATYGRAYTANAAIGTVHNGIPYALTSPTVGYDFTAGDSFWMRHSCSVSSSSLLFPGSSQTAASGDTGFVSAAASSQVPATGNMTTPGGGAAFGGPQPMMILGVPAAPMAAVCILGDSIADGNGDTVDSHGNLGYATRGLDSVNGYPVPWMKQTAGGDLFSKNTLDTGPRKRSLWPFVTHLVCALGTNDIANGESLGTMQTYATNLWTAAKRTIGPYGKPLQVAQVLVFPRTTSSDSWATAGNQTAVSGFTVGAVRDQFNAWVLTQVGGGLLDAAINCNQYVENQSSLSKWITNGSANYPTTDGTHPSSALHILAAQAINSWALGIVP